jgi:uncharacterized protein GlcG (DUF336 family)
MFVRRIGLVVCLLVLSGSTLAQAECYGNVRDVKANGVQTRWLETTANDGKPMTIAIANGANGLVFSAKKAGAVWLNGNVSVCRAGGATNIALKNTRTTSNVPMLARMGFPASLSTQIVSGQIKLAGGGWNGTFVGQ